MPFAALLCRLAARARRTRAAATVAPETSAATGIPSRDPARPSTRDRSGFALEGTIIVLVLVGALIGFAATWVVTITRGAATDYRGSRVSYAAEAGADAVMAQLEVAMEDGVISSAELAGLTLPELSGFTFEDMEVTRDPMGAVIRPINSGNLAGLYAINLPIDIAIAARDAASNRGSVMVSVTAQSIPLFQFGVFYEGDLEIHNGPRLDFEGWVHTNGNLYLSSNNTYFASRITTPGSVFWQRKAYSERLNGVYINNEAGTPVRLDFDSRSLPDDAAFRSRSESKFNSRLMTRAHNVAPLRLPLSGLPAVELIKPRNGGDDTQTRDVKLAWKADWYIDLPLDDPVALKNGNTLCSTANLRSAAVSIRPGGKTLPGLSDCKNIFSFKPNAFRDGREDIGVDVLEIDIAALRNWSGGNTSRETNILYITFSGLPTPIGGGDYPAVRLVNGAELPNRITIATSAPVYVKGDYNSVGWEPSSIMGDAITFLSQSFSETATNMSCGSDTNACSGPTSNHAAGPAGAVMKVYAAVAAGHSATPCDYADGACGGTPPYGGGLENFPRFLENWSGRTLLYRGSLVSLFESSQADRHNWAWRTYYGAPIRDWKFEMRFQQPDNLPPGTPTVGNVFQTAFRPVF